MSNRQEDIILSVEDPITALHYLWDEQKRRTKACWKMKDGNLIDIKNMTDDHLDNTVAMLERMYEERSLGSNPARGTT